MAGLLAHAPLAGRVVPLSDVPDPVFAEQMVGPGIAIDPDPGAGTVRAHSPLAGTIGALHPHAYAVESGGRAVLVHLGLDTVTLKGEPFAVEVEQGQQVRLGQVVITWHIERIGALSPLVPVIALGAGQIELLAPPGSAVETGTPIFRIPDPVS